MQYTRIPVDTFKKIQMNAGVLARNFDPATGEVQEKDLVGATTGGVNFSATADFTDFGEDIDNCPDNMKELKKKGYTTAKCSGNFVTVDPAAGKSLVGGADIDSKDATHIIPRNDLADEDFEDLWLVGDYSEINESNDAGDSAGFIAIHMMNALSTGGFQIQTAKNGKGQFAFEFTAHYSMEAQNTVPYELYIRAGEAAQTEVTADETV